VAAADGGTKVQINVALRGGAAQALPIIGKAQTLGICGACERPASAGQAFAGRRQ
jgi:hypothetical protein